MTAAEPALTQHKITVLLIDDQPIIGEAVRRMLAGEDDIVFHYCKDATQAVEEANEIEPDRDPPGPGHARHRRPDPGQDVPRERRDPRDADDRPLDQGRAEDQGRGLRPRGQRLHRQAPRPARAPRPDPLPLQGLHQPPPAQRGLPGPPGQPEDAGQATWPRRPSTSSRSCPTSSRRAPIRTDWRFIPSADLGGDSFGYDWLDDDHFAFYLLDVSGHGVGAALLSVSALNALRSQSLPQTDFREPGQVLAALNRAFQMDQQNGLYLHDLVRRSTTSRPADRLRRRRPPPAVLLTGPTADEAKLHRPRIQGPDGRRRCPTSNSRAPTVQVEAFGQLFLFSDGAYEIERADGSMWPFSDFIEFMSRPTTPGVSDMDALMAHVRALSGKHEFADDFSIVEFQFEVVSRPPQIPCEANSSIDTDR